MNRREFLSSSAAALTAATALPPSVHAALQGGAAPGRPRRYAIVGTGGRGSSMWGTGVKAKWGDTVQFVGLCDPNPKRAEVVRGLLGVECPVFTDFDRMVREARPDLIAVTTVDAHHAEYIVRALDLGIDVITEKPMTTDEKQCQAVIDAEKRNKRKIIVGHNMRFSPAHVKIKELMLSQPVGPIRSVDFHWYLDTSHGTDYFRRWHGIKAKSGSLWVHKATHHFDYVNWLLDAEPVQVQAYGGIKRYGAAGPFRAINCRTCPHTAKCPFYWDMTKSASAMRLYGGEVEKVDGYLRDACVFRPEITTYDTMTATIKYSTDVILSYSLNAYMPIEGYSLCFNGDGGRVEIRSYANQPWKVDQEFEVSVIKAFGQRTMVPVPTAEGEHGGADDVLRNLIFRRPEVPAHLRIPDSRAGAMSALTGIAARRSCEENRPITISDLVTF
ncbi:4,5-dihydroxyphthalate dehydrogenase [Luteitalea sp. TBR-22]|uniref:Gfo/Idh/MocA family oxidoreductase n=1 Tax=Luteitalea sp. TBR-22 TaxID=2802971 RepID=UPI001AF37B75|nr:Gfo/Idh/MocA family oxidoreductase [Luteitalea sp. TBR-22]BCS34336.1 4,5-dihydroxyphthalate dehydrogenase [Luteitalea sp. TBR-22]